tara:strand:+ start:889 stop:1623 length:735 start_codon:yes stop_codon:yes gene_type:complete
MSKIKVDTIQSTQHSTSTIGFTSTGATVNGDCSATTFTGSGANLTNLPSANLTGAIPANLLTNAGGGGSFEFVQKLESSTSVTSLDVTNLEYDTLYRFMIPDIVFAAASNLAISPMVDNNTTPANASDCISAQYVGLNNRSVASPSTQNYWQFDFQGFQTVHLGGYFDLYTSDRPWLIGKLMSRTTPTYGNVTTWGIKSLQANTENDSNQTGSYAKVSGVRFHHPSSSQNITGGRILIYKYKES